ncbi:hypothetical protein HMPREF0239_00893 [Clostridium sp. ATCC BAA-442]|nr:hypothetical protein HMPREF0239_00893 [Clostridium sp. ATCC BAA-442]
MCPFGQQQHLAGCVANGLLVKLKNALFQFTGQQKGVGLIDMLPL